MTAVSPSRTSDRPIQIWFPFIIFPKKKIQYCIQNLYTDIKSSSFFFKSTNDFGSNSLFFNFFFARKMEFVHYLFKRLLFWIRILYTGI